MAEENAEALAQIESLVAGVFDEQVIGSSSEAMHLFQAVTEAIEQLGAIEVAFELSQRYAWYSGGLRFDSAHWGEDVDPTVVVDAIAAFAKEGAELFRGWMVEHGLTTVKLTIYMACHKGFSQVVISSNV